MKLFKDSKTYEEYLNIKKDSDEILEYINEIIYVSPTPSIKHQRISMKFSIELIRYIKNNKKGYEVFAAPTNIELNKKNILGKNIIIPDISVICKNNGSFSNTKFIGIPILIVEILSPSNQSHDLITKLNLYMKYGIKEYWIINTMKNFVIIYTLNEENMYDLWEGRGTGIISSKVLEGFSVHLNYIFEI